MILSQLLRGLGDVIGALETVGPADLQRALIRAAELAYTRGGRPGRGHHAHGRQGRGRGRERGPPTWRPSCGRAAAGATAALARTPEQLPQLKAAGVVDAGGRGLCVLLEAL